MYGKVFFLVLVLFFLPTGVDAARTNGTTLETSTVFSPYVQDFSIDGVNVSYGEFGFALAGTGDLDDDENLDFVNFSYVGDILTGGAIFVTFLDADGAYDGVQTLSTTTDGLPALDANDFPSFSDVSGITGIGDFNDDGVEDIVIGAGGDDDRASSAGAVYILYMETSGMVASSSKISASTSALLATELASSDSFGGLGLTSVGDLDGDGITDIVVGAPGDDDGALGAGAVYTLFLTATGSVKDLAKISASTSNFGGQLSASDGFGSSIVNIGDLNNDGVTDIAVGAYLSDTGGNGAGAVYVFFMNTDGSIDGYQKIAEGVGGFNDDLNSLSLFGETLAGPGDLDGDGVEDLIVGTPQYDQPIAGGNANGTLHILFLNTDGTVKDWTLFNLSAGPVNDGKFGKGLGILGDVDGNGIPEILVGDWESAEFGSSTWFGTVRVLFLAESTITADATAAITEGSATDSVSVLLNSEPLAQVDVTFSVSGSEATTSVGGICFTATGTDAGSGQYAPCTAWNATQTISITATDDSDAEGSHTADLILTASSSDDSYDGTTGTTTLTIADNDTAADSGSSGGAGRQSPLPHEDDEDEDDATTTDTTTGGGGTSTTEEVIESIRQQLVALILQVILMLQQLVLEQGGQV